MGPLAGARQTKTQPLRTRNRLCYNRGACRSSNPSPTSAKADGRGHRPPGAGHSGDARRPPARPFIRRLAQPVGLHARRRRGRGQGGNPRALRGRRRRHRSAHAPRRTSAAWRGRRRAVRSDRGRDDGGLRRRLRRTSAPRWPSASGLPVFLYEEASTNPARKNLEDIRRGEFEGLAAKMASPGWAPDFGPASPHETAGAVGLRRADAAHRLQHQPQHRPPGCREEDCRRHPPQQRRAPIREGHGREARRSQPGAGVDELDEL